MPEMRVINTFQATRLRVTGSTTPQQQAEAAINEIHIARYFILTLAREEPMFEGSCTCSKQDHYTGVR